VIDGQHPDLTHRAAPARGARALAFLPEGDDRTVKLVGLVASGAAFVASLVLLAQFDVADPAAARRDADLDPVDRGDVLAGRRRRQPAADPADHVPDAADPAGLLGSVTDRLKGYVAAFLVLEAAVIGVFAATDLLLFYVFFEFTLVPMYLIIGIWGGPAAATPRQVLPLHAARRPADAGRHPVPVQPDRQLRLRGVLALELASVTEQRWLFAAFVLAFAVKVPLFPVHTWLPDAHTEAPTGGSVFLAGVLLKMGTFGLLRYALPFFPDATVEFAPWLLGISVDRHPLRRDRRADAVRHQEADRVLVGQPHGLRRARHLRPERDRHLGVGGADGQPRPVDRRAVPADRVPLRAAPHAPDRAFGGLAKQVPVMAGLWLLVSMSSLALPGLNGFVGEFPILLGTFQTNRTAGVLAAFGAVLAALYLLWAYQRMFHGPLEGADNENTTDLKPREIGVLAPLVVLIVAIGLYPKPLFDLVEPVGRPRPVEVGVGDGLASSPPPRPRGGHERALPRPERPSTTSSSPTSPGPASRPSSCPTAMALVLLLVAIARAVSCWSPPPPWSRRRRRLAGRPRARRARRGRDRARRRAAGAGVRLPRRPRWCRPGAPG
jgi:NADH-quinone oxidoreductase subunit M